MVTKMKTETTGKIIEPVMTFNYLRIRITSERKLYTKITRQATKARKIKIYKQW